MEFALKVCTPAKEKAALVVAALGAELSPTALALDVAADGALSRALKAAGFEGKSGQTQTMYNLPGIAAETVLVVGVGEAKDLDGRGLQKVVAAATRALGNQRKAVSFLAELPVKDRDLNQRLTTLAQTTLETIYRFEDFKSKKTPADKGLSQLTLAVPDKAAASAGKAAVAWGEAVARGQNRARDLGNLPPNVCTPVFLAEQARALAKDQPRLTVKVLDEAEIKKLGMGAFIAVAQGSDNPGRLVILDYKGGKKSEAPVALVGKGITFDTGGISIKPAATMDEMKFDMCGAASVMGVMTALVESKLPINVVGVLAAAENMPSGKATRPGDIVTTMSGQTVEILNTDAEGRLVLCDALTYVGRYKPAIVIDIATLTGACVVALGKVVSGLFSPSDELADALLKAGQDSGDRAWRLPVWQDYQELLDSPFADMGNIGAPYGGAITAACFLARFTKDYTWAHLDIAGTAWHSGGNKGSTGRPVPLLLEYLRARAA
jgi:leucyl aminopeptidase